MIIKKKNISILQASVCGCILIVLILFSSCHTTKKATKTPAVTYTPGTSFAKEKIISPKFIKEKLQENTIEFHTFSARAKLDITTPQSSQSGITAFIRMQKDSDIWISVRPLLGIELARVLITPDSVKMINFLKRSITLRSADSMQQLLKIPFNFNTLQDLIIGNPMFLTDRLLHLTSDSSGALITFSCKEDSLISSYALFAKNYLLYQYGLKQMSATSTASRYSNEKLDVYQSIDGRMFSTERRLTVYTDQEVKVDIKFNRVEFDKPLSFPFPMPDKFDLK